MADTLRFIGPTRLSQVHKLTYIMLGNGLVGKFVPESCPRLRREAT